MSKIGGVANWVLRASVLVTSNQLSYSPSYRFAGQLIRVSVRGKFAKTWRRGGYLTASTLSNYQLANKLLLIGDNILRIPAIEPYRVTIYPVKWVPYLTRFSIYAYNGPPLTEEEMVEIRSI